MKSDLFQNMAPSTQRTLAVAIALGVIAVMIYMFAVQPCELSLDKAKRDLQQLEDQKLGVDRDLKESAKVKTRLEDIDTALQPFQNALLTPLLESWAMQAKTLLDGFAAEAGLVSADYSELPVRALPVPKPLPKQLYARRPIKVTCRGSYAAIVSFIMRVEREMPYVSTQSFKLQAQQDPAKQLGEVVFEWPVRGAVTVSDAKGGAKK